MATQENIRRSDPLGTLTRRAFIGGLAGAGLYAAAPEPVRGQLLNAVRAGLHEWNTYDPNRSSVVVTPRTAASGTEVPRAPIYALTPESRPISLLSDEELLPGELPVEGNHFLTPEKIKEILARNGSPAVNTAKTFYDLGKKFNIGAAIPLAFFYQESEMGLKGVARFTKSIGNIRYTGDPFKDVEGYNGYSSYEEGIYDWFDLIRNYYINKRKLDTVEKIVPVYAPRVDNNDEEAYIETVRWCWLKWYREVNT